ncbi:MAG: hypothetical protein PHG08_00885 [Bacilli bacterium]|nr:hypothetical protein [Bacilli bacterium]
MKTKKEPVFLLVTTQEPRIIVGVYNKLQDAKRNLEDDCEIFTILKNKRNK